MGFAEKINTRLENSSCLSYLQRVNSAANNKKYNRAFPRAHQRGEGVMGIKAHMKIGTTIRGYRLQKGMSQGDIEKRTGLLRCYLSRVENGHTVPSLDTLAKIAQALDLPLADVSGTAEGQRTAEKAAQASRPGPAKP